MEGNIDRFIGVLRTLVKELISVREVKDFYGFGFYIRSRKLRLTDSDLQTASLCVSGRNDEIVESYGEPESAMANVYKEVFSRAMPEEFVEDLRFVLSAIRQFTGDSFGTLYLYSDGVEEARMVAADSDIVVKAETLEDALGNLLKRLYQLHQQKR